MNFAKGSKNDAEFRKKKTAISLKIPKMLFFSSLNFALICLAKNNKFSQFLFFCKTDKRENFRILFHDRNAKK